MDCSSLMILRLHEPKPPPAPDNGIDQPQSSGERKQKPTFPDLDAIRKHLGFAPLNKVRETLKRTTQFARNVMNKIPMRRHHKSRFPAANIHSTQ